MNKVFFTLVALALAVAFAGPDSSSSTTKPSESSSSETENQKVEREENDRNVQLQFQPTQVQIESSSKTATSKSSLRFSVESEGGLKMRLRYSTANGVTGSFRARFLKVVEFDPSTTGASSPYVGGASLSTYDLTSAKVNMVELPASTVAGVALRNFQYTNGPVTITMHVAGAVATDGTQTFTPGSLKFDVRIKGFAFTKPGSRLALLAMIDSSSKAEDRATSTEAGRGQGKNEGEVNVGGSAFLSFVKTAQCTGGPAINVVAAPVTSVSSGEDSDSTKDKGESTNKVYFTFMSDAPADICWDPKVGAELVQTSTTLAKSSASSMTFASWLMAGLLSVVVALGL